VYDNGCSFNTAFRDTNYGLIGTSYNPQIGNQFHGLVKVTGQMAYPGNATLTDVSIQSAVGITSGIIEVRSITKSGTKYYLAVKPGAANSPALLSYDGNATVSNVGVSLTPWAGQSQGVLNVVAPAP
jgi:hypothetical protein